jgi:hypothetical protein
LTLPDREHAVLWNDFLLCVEMVVFATALMFAFPVTDFQGGIPNRRVLDNVKEVFTVNDILHDLYHNFTPAYGDYALQRSQGEMPGTATGIINMPRHRAARSVDEASSARCAPMSGSAPTSPAAHESIHTHARAHSLSGNLNPVAREMAQRYRGRSRRMSFNRLLRGTQPVRATLRTRPGPDGAPLGDIETGPGGDVDEDECGGDGQATRNEGVSPGGCMQSVDECTQLSQFGICGGAEETKEAHLLEGGGEKESARIGRLSLVLKFCRKSPSPPGWHGFPVNIVSGVRVEASDAVSQRTEPDSGGSDDSNNGRGGPSTSTSIIQHTATTEEAVHSKRGAVFDTSASASASAAVPVVASSPFPLATVNDLHRVDSCEWGDYA